MNTRLTPDEAPSEIWLQYYDDEAPYPDAPLVAKEDRGDMTWAEEAINPHDVKYVRASKVRELEAQVASLTTELASSVNGSNAKVFDSAHPPKEES